MSSEVDIQRQYYAETAHRYDELHLLEKDEHYFALAFLAAMIEFHNIQSILDIGAGTGRTLLYLKQHCPRLRVVGIEPVEALRKIAYEQGLSQSEMIDGDALRLSYTAGEFDLVCEFGVLHHIRRPELAVAEMLRVAGKAIFISDSNNFGQGSFAARAIKQGINALGLWPVADWFKTRGKGYTISEEDGLAYSYSVFNNFKQIEHVCKSVHILNTRGGRINPYRTADHIALLGIK